MAVVSAEVWEEDGGFLRHHSEYTVFILVGRHRRIHIDVCAILWAKSWMQRPCVGNRSTLEKCCFKKSFKIVFFIALSPPSSGSCRSPWCWSSSPTLWWPTSWLSPLGSAWQLRSCCRGKTMRGSITFSSLSLLSCQNCHIFTKDKEKTNTSNA